MKKVKVIVVVVFTFLFSNWSMAQEKKHEIGLSVGILAGGEAYVEEQDQYFDFTSGLMIHSFYDHFVAEYLSIGGYLNFSFPEIEFAEEGSTFTEVGLAIKPRFFIQDVLTIKPGLNIGYRTVNSNNIDFIGGKIQGLGINLTTELQLNIHETFKPFLDIGFITQPAGGNDEFTITFSPVLTVRAGIAFAL